jgi:hypothetical protein
VVDSDAAPTNVQAILLWQPDGRPQLLRTALLPQEHPMTIHHDTHSGSNKTADRGSADGMAKTVEAAEAALREAGVDVASESKAALNGMMAGSHEWMTWAQDAGQANMKAWQALIACRTPKAAISIQTALMQEQFKLLADNTHRMSMATWKTALKANEAPR